MSKILIKLIVITMLFSILPNVKGAQANTNAPTVTDIEAPTVTEIDTEEVEREIEQDFGVEVAEELDLNAKYTSDDKMIVDTDIITEDIAVSTKVEYDTEQDTISVEGTVVEDDGTETKQNFDVIVHQVEGEAFSATFIDTKTGEIYDVDTIEAQASAWPLVIIAAVARYGINYAIKKYGKKAVNNAVKSKSYGKVLSSVSSLSKNKINHIMQKKHNWNKVTTPNWDNVSKVISHVMRNGKESAYKSVRKKTLKMNGKTVTVTFTRIKGKIKISDAWVNK